MPYFGKKISSDENLDKIENSMLDDEFYNYLRTYIECPNCEGREYINGDLCSRCGGFGEVHVDN